MCRISPSNVCLPSQWALCDAGEKKRDGTVFPIRASSLSASLAQWETINVIFFSASFLAIKPGRRNRHSCFSIGFSHAETDKKRHPARHRIDDGRWNPNVRDWRTQNAHWNNCMHIDIYWMVATFTIRAVHARSRGPSTYSINSTYQSFRS